MKRERIGFATMLMGIIFAAPGDSIFWWIGVIGFGLPILLACLGLKDCKGVTV